MHKQTVVLLVALSFAAGAFAAPYMLDPLRVAPHIYELEFENERVRVLRRTIRSGETPPVMSQSDRVIIYLNPCAWLEEDGEGEERMQSFKFGTPVWTAEGTHGGQAFDVIQQCNVLEVELLE